MTILNNTQGERASEKSVARSRSPPPSAFDLSELLDALIGCNYGHDGREVDNEAVVTVPLSQLHRLINLAVDKTVGHMAATDPLNAGSNAGDSGNHRGDDDQDAHNEEKDGAIERELEMASIQGNIKAINLDDEVGLRNKTDHIDGAVDSATLVAGTLPPSPTGVPPPVTTTAQDVAQTAPPATSFQPPGHVFIPQQQRWYAVTRGLQVGVFSGWPTVQPLVSGVSNACYQRYSTYNEAVTAFQTSLDAGYVRVFPP